MILIEGIILCMLQDECSDIRQMEPSAVDGGRNTRILCPGAVRRDVVHRLMGCPSLDILSGRTEGVRAAPEMLLIRRSKK